ncbi:hypothetical protein E3N88_10037 [Mikania micrantha]|uniref:Uncharacterized protein n=1 Tax=Mikania micrantha TaxID=192012 RepID=A0A5N6PC61_9ASTR|nr:hypothetical protein E3N88_10037 [Mikania micrantha]
MDSAPVSDTICNSRPYWILSALPHRAHGLAFGYPGENFPVSRAGVEFLPHWGISVPADHMDSAPVSDTICNSRPYWILSALPHRAHGFAFGYPGENFPVRSPIPGLLPPEHA